MRFVEKWDSSEVKAKKRLKAKGRGVFVGGDGEECEANASRHLGIAKNVKLRSKTSYLRQYFPVVSSGFHTDRMVVSTPEVVTVELRAKAAEAGSRALIGMCYNRKMKLVSAGKWTQGGPATDDQMVASLNNCLQGNARMALSDLKFRSKTTVDCTGENGEDVDVLLDDVVERWNQGLF